MSSRATGSIQHDCEHRPCLLGRFAAHGGPALAGREGKQAEAAMSAESVAGSFLAWSLVTSLSVAMLAGAAWIAVVLWVTAADLLKGRGR